MKIRVGFGFDVHRLVEGRELWLGGIRLDHSLGLLGHSDADVLIHAICDALLGAAHLRDIGYHFPDTSSEYEMIDSKILLRKICPFHNFANTVFHIYEPYIVFTIDERGKR